MIIFGRGRYHRGKMFNSASYTSPLSVDPLTVDHQNPNEQNPVYSDFNGPPLFWAIDIYIINSCIMFDEKVECYEGNAK